jgi:hypothetical protein
MHTIIPFRAKFIWQYALYMYHQRDIFRKKIWPVESGNRAVVSGGGIKTLDTTYVVSGFPLLRPCPWNLNDVMHIVGQVDVMLWLCRRNVMATSLVWFYYFISIPDVNISPCSAIFRGILFLLKKINK